MRGNDLRRIPEKKRGGVVKGMEFQDLVMQREGLENKQKHKKQWTLMRELNIEQLTIL